jgi:hypothetical protein
MPTLENSGNLTTDGTEQTIYTSTTTRLYKLYLNLKNMASGDAVEIRVKKQLTGDSTTDPVFYARFEGAQPAEGKIVTTPGDFCAGGGLSFTIKRLAGTDRSYRWEVFSP